MERVCRHYSDMGVKGFKIDFMDRDDAACVNFLYDAARMAAKYRMLVDFHGVFKPTGLQRTYPNVINFEGVKGQENTKWSSLESYNQVQYDVQIPFIRMLAGQMDYTQGAMLNSTKETFHASNSNPMSQGTRCHQLAMYTVFFSPLNMLCDSPTHYEEEPECTEFIAKIPVVWDQSIALTSMLVSMWPWRAEAVIPGMLALSTIGLPATSQSTSLRWVTFLPVRKLILMVPMPPSSRKIM